MKKCLRLLRRDERGAAAIEYAMLVVFIALVIGAGASQLGTAVSSLFTSIASSPQLTYTAPTN